MTKFIAEIGSNHNQDLDRAKALIHKAKEIGCWGVKFQLFRAKKLWRYEKEQEKFRLWELPREFVLPLWTEAYNIGIKFGFSVFDLEDVQCFSRYADFLKIGSHEILWTELIFAAAQTKKPLIISTGMAINDEIKHAINTVLLATSPVALKNMTLLCCQSTYPATFQMCYLEDITNYKWRFHLSVGWSDHTRDRRTIYTASKFNADIIEFHMDLDDNKGYESSIGHCWLASNIEPIIKDIKLDKSGHTNYKNTCNIVSPILRLNRTSPTDGKRPFIQVRNN